MFRLNDWLLAVSSEKEDALFPDIVFFFFYVFQKCSYILKDKNYVIIHKKIEQA